MSKKNKIKRPMPVAASGPVTRTEFNPDYTYIKRDLARIGMLAGIAFIVLIALSFVLR
jgi:hypothetical protein